MQVKITGYNSNNKLVMVLSRSYQTGLNAVYA